MTHTEMLEHVRHVVGNVVRERGEEPPAIDADTPLLRGPIPIDSLDLAVIVVELEKLTGKDPFQGGFINFQTAGELAALYVDA